MKCLISCLMLSLMLLEEACHAQDQNCQDADCERAMKRRQVVEEILDEVEEVEREKREALFGNKHGSSFGHLSGASARSHGLRKHAGSHSNHHASKFHGHDLHASNHGHLASKHDFHVSKFDFHHSSKPDFHHSSNFDSHHSGKADSHHLSKPNFHHTSKPDFRVSKPDFHHSSKPDFDFHHVSTSDFHVSKPDFHHSNNHDLHPASKHGHHASKHDLHHVSKHGHQTRFSRFHSKFGKKKRDIVDAINSLTAEVVESEDVDVDEAVEAHEKERRDADAVPQSQNCFGSSCNQNNFGKKKREIVDAINSLTAEVLVNDDDDSVDEVVEAQEKERRDADPQSQNCFGSSCNQKNFGRRKRDIIAAILGQLV